MRSFVLLLAGATLALVAACPDNDWAADGDADVDGDSDTDVDSDSDVDGEGAPCSTSATCGAGLYCSAAGRCIASGTCLVDEDCEAGERCGPGSRLCLGPGEECRADGDCDEGLICDLETSTCVGCGASEFDLTLLPPNVMVLLDRSGSMDNEVDGRTRWDVAKDAIEGVTTAFDSEIRFGLATYSSCLPGGCSAGSIVVPIADANAAAINGFLAPLLGEGSSRGDPPRYLCDSGDPETSTGRSLLALVGEPSLQDPARVNAVLLVTDGEESGACTDGGAEAGPTGAAALLGQEVPVRTYVVGFTVSSASLDAVAAAGGTGTAYRADDGAALAAAFESIAAAVASCDFRLEGAPPDEETLFVYFNDDPAGVAEDPVDGWTYDPATNTLHFHGAACERIQSGEVADIDVVYGCEGPVIG